MFLSSLLVGDKAKHTEDERFVGNKPDFTAVGLTTAVARRYRKTSSFPPTAGAGENPTLRHVC